jgi:hypothetical protein
MNPNESQQELLLRYLEDRVTPEERQQVVASLRTDAAARAFLRTVSEQAVMVADLERIAVGRAAALHPRPAAAGQRRKLVPVNFRSWPWSVAAAAAIVLLVVVALQFATQTKPEIARVSKVTGSSQFFGSNGRTENALVTGTPLVVGDTLETRSCDAWIELELRDGSKLTIAGNSTLRILEAAAGRSQFKLLEGSLWKTPAQGSGAEPILIQTASLAAEVRGTQFDIQASPTETMLRVNQGSARVTPSSDGRGIDVPEGYQVVASLGKLGALAASVQPTPINYWACDLWRTPEVRLGRWLQPTGGERARLGAEPLLWPRAGRDPLLLYAVAIAAWKSTDQPVLLQAGSTLYFRGRTERPQTVRFGFSTQKMRGAFAGKFEVDVKPNALGQVGETWEVELPLANFRALHPHLAVSPDDLELTDVYALTINDDAGLEINHIELLPAVGTIP